MHRLLPVALALLALATPLVSAAERPDIIVILADDQGWGDLSINGNTNLNTPYVDSLAREGASFDRFYVCPVCSPTRAEFLTGRYHPRGGVYGTSKGAERLDLDESTIAEAFKAAGYTTACFGKWHNGAQFPYHPNARGFDEYYGLLSGHMPDYFTPMLDHNGVQVRGGKYITDDITDKAIDYISEHLLNARDRGRGQDPAPAPFFVYVAYNSPHSPMQVPEKWWKKFKDNDLALRGTNAKMEDVQHTRAALAMCENIDWNVGRILDAVRSEGEENTIVLYFCDNGPNGNRWNGGMKGIKGSTDEGGVRSPLFISWPGHIAPRTRVDQIAGAIDLYPTLAKLAGVPLTNKKPVDGVSFATLLVDQAAGAPKGSTYGKRSQKRMLFSTWNNEFSVRQGRYRLDHTGKLFDVLNDPAQKTNLNKREPKIKAALQVAVDAWKKDMKAELGTDNRPYIVGHASSKETRLPAADGIGRGNVRWSSQHPNSSFFTGWKSPDDSITWDVEIAEAGDYDVELFYTCPAADVGSTIELSFNDARLTGTIEEPNDPPLRGAEHDHVPRTESYVKNFRPLKLGVIHLNQARGQLTLRALKVPGEQVADVQQLRLVRVQKKVVQ